LSWFTEDEKAPEIIIKSTNRVHKQKLLLKAWNSGKRCTHEQKGGIIAELIRYSLPKTFCTVLGCKQRHMNEFRIILSQDLGTNFLILHSLFVVCKFLVV
jgi:hypothetical protein